MPVGVQDTRAGALAAADNYVAIASQTVEQNPVEFAQLVDTVYTPAARSGTLAQAARVRAADVADMRNYAQGGRAVAVIAARRLDRYTPGAGERDELARRVRLGSGALAAPELEPRRHDTHLATGPLARGLDEHRANAGAGPVRRVRRREQQPKRARSTPASSE